VPNGIPNPTAEGATALHVMLVSPGTASQGYNMFTTFADPFNALLDLQRALEARLASDWLQDSTTSRGPFPPINMFQQGDDIVAIIELPGIDRNELHIDARRAKSFLRGSTSVFRA
jgi:HSP20 family protein